MVLIEEASPLIGYEHADVWCSVALMPLVLVGTTATRHFRKRMLTYKD